LNPYKPCDVAPSLHPEDDAFQDQLEARVRLTRRFLIAFGVFAFAWPVVTSYFTGVLNIDMFAFFVTASILTTSTKTIRRFPKVVLILFVYPLVFALNASTMGLVKPANWIPARNSPVLILSLISATWAVFGIYMLLKCHLIARRSESETIVLDRSDITDANDSSR